MSDFLRKIEFVNPEWLKNNRANPALRVVDGSWHLPTSQKDGRAEYLVKHIPQAVFFDLDHVSDPTTNLPHMLPKAEDFARAVGALGISENDLIVVYDQLGLFSAPRVAWMFALFGAKTVKILDGGLPAWCKEGGEVSSTPPSIQPQIFHASTPQKGVADRTQIKALCAQKMSDAQLVDARPAPRFRGEAAEPRPGLRAGHIPHARNLPFSDVLDNGKLRPVSEIQAAMHAAGVEASRPLICSCGSGVSALVIAFAMAQTGAEIHSIYDGSWAEWGGDASLPIATDT